MTMNKLGNLVLDKWVEGDGPGTTLYNSINGEAIASTSSDGIDISSMYDYARVEGGQILQRKLVNRCY